MVDGRSHDLVVVGAGPAGTAAAIAAGRSGCSVLLVEKTGCCGGMATSGMVNPMLGNYYLNPETGANGSIIAGLLGEIFDRLDGHGARLRFRYSNDENAVFSDAFDDAWLRVIYDRMLAEAGVTVLYHSQLLVSSCSDGHIDSLKVLTKGGVREFCAAAFIDSTGDADLAAMSGAEVGIGREEDGLCQPCSTMFRMGGVDKQKLLSGGLRAAREAVNSLFREAKEKGDLEFPFKGGMGIYEFPRPGVVHFNATRMGGETALTGERLSELETEGRRQTAMLADWLVKSVPCFEDAFLESIAAHVGIRETRRVKGRYEMSRGDIVEGTRFEDGIARSAYFIDIHDPKGPGGLHARNKEVGAQIKDDFKPRQYYEIPMRSLQLPTIDNLLVACRAISTDHYAHAATRVMGTLTAVGEAAGLAAGMAKASGKTLTEIDGAEVRAKLRYLDVPLDF